MQSDGAHRNGPVAVHRLFRVRGRVIALLALTIALLADELEHRWWLVAALALIVVPYNMVAERAARRSASVPGWVAYIDQLLGLVTIAVYPDLWTAGLIVMATSLALTASTSTPRRTVIPAALSVAAVATIGYYTQDGFPALVGAMGFLAGAVLAISPTALVTAYREAIAREHRDLVENIDAIVWVLAAGEEQYRSLSPATSRILGYPEVNLRDVAFWLDHVDPDDRPVVEEARSTAMATGQPQNCDYRVTTGDGSRRWFHEAITLERATPPDPDVLRGVIIDVTARRAAEEERAVFAEVVDNLDTAILVASTAAAPEGTLAVKAVNPAGARIFGSTPQRMLGQSLDDVIGLADASLTERALAVVRGEPGFTLDRIGGIGIDRQRTYAVRVFALPGRAVGVTLDDVTEATMVASALRRQALHDGLTGLPNRTLLRDRLQYALSDARRRSERVALILLDLNHFKDVNDALGHQYGDRLLVAFARRLQTLLRECDTISRLGGDEFALLLTDATNDGASRVVRKVTEAMQEPFEIEGITVQTTASIGVALFPEHADDADLLTQRADVAMYNAKRNGGGWAVYSPHQDKSSVERLTLLSELHNELDDERPQHITLHYQPILDLWTDRITGVEALLRWNHTEFGWLDPELVVELAELSGLIQPLARFVAREAMTAASDWRADGHEIRVAINLSARNLYDRQLVTWLDDMLRRIELPHHLLKCELTESQVMDDPVLAMSVISQLREIGIHTAIDDFGTGYSSLAYLRRLPVDEIKIDKSFVTSMLADPTDMTIVRTIIDLAHNLGMIVLAEGVEDEGTTEALRDFGCDRIQGHHIGKPMTAVELRQLLHERRRQPTAADL